MTNGLEVRDVVKIKASGLRGVVRAIEDINDKQFANIMLSDVQDDGLIMYRADEVEKIGHLDGKDRPILD